MATPTLDKTDEVRVTTGTPPVKRTFSFGRAAAWTFMILVVLASLFPFYWILRTALSSNNALYAGSDSILPVQFSWGGFERVSACRPGRRRSPPVVPGRRSTSGDTCSTRWWSPP